MIFLNYAPKKSLLALFFLFASFALVSARNVSECKTELKEIAQALLDSNVQNPRISAFVSSGADLTEEDLIDLCDQVLLYRKELSAKAREVESIKNDLIIYLRSFVASGVDCLEVDPNLAFFVNVQNPDFVVTFKNPAGEIKTRKYALKVKSWGLKVELTIRVDFIKIIGSGFNYYDSANKEYELGYGFDVAWYPVTNPATKAGTVFRCVSIHSSHVPGHQFSLIGVCLTFAKIKNTNCTLMITGIAFGLGGSIIGPGLEGALVTGGKMTPMAEGNSSK